MITFDTAISENWITHTAREIRSTVENGTITIPHNLGNGFIRQVKLHEGFNLCLMNIEFRQDVKFMHKPSRGADVFPVIFYPANNNGQPFIPGQPNSVLPDSPHGFFTLSKGKDTPVILPAGTRSTTLALSVTKKWLFANITYPDHPKNYIGELLTSNESFLLCDNITLSMHLIISKILKIDDSDFLSAMQFASKSFELLILFLEKVNRQNKPSALHSMDRRDLEQIFKIESLLSANLTKPPSLDEICLEAGMSESKLQKCFKTVFGKSLYQHIIALRMSTAKQMIEEQNMSISEIGHNVGYSNLSHFTSAFYKAHGCNPKEFQKINRLRTS